LLGRAKAQMPGIAQGAKAETSSEMAHGEIKANIYIGPKSCYNVQSAAKIICMLKI